MMMIKMIVIIIIRMVVIMMTYCWRKAFAKLIHMNSNDSLKEKMFAQCFS